MTIRNIRQGPHPILTTLAHELERNENVRIARDLLDTLNASSRAVGMVAFLRSMSGADQ